jgi:hypothetical protein
MIMRFIRFLLPFSKQQPYGNKVLAGAGPADGRFVETASGDSLLPTVRRPVNQEYT